MFSGTGEDIGTAASEGIDTPSSIDSTTSADYQDSTDVSGSIHVSTIVATTTSTVPKTTAVVQTTSPTPIARDCSDILDQGFTENYGIYCIQPSGDSEFFEVVCDMKTNGQAWIVVQRRFDGSEDFYLPWEDYKNGFGNLTGEHWLGLQKLYKLTRNGAWQLRIELEDFFDNNAYVEYSNFTIGDESTNYTLNFRKYSGNAGDSLIDHANMAFTTYDQDHDTWGEGNCAASFKGAWWYYGCFYSNLNGLYLGSPVEDQTGIVWWHWKENYEMLKKSEMKMRRIW